MYAQLMKRRAELSETADTPDTARQKHTIDMLLEMQATIDQEAAARVPSSTSPARAGSVCRHLAPVEVRSVVTDELLARLCPACDTQLPA
jgi:hypothetical protein